MAFSEEMFFGVTKRVNLFLFGQILFRCTARGHRSWWRHT